MNLSMKGISLVILLFCFGLNNVWADAESFVFFNEWTQSPFLSADSVAEQNILHVTSDAMAGALDMRLVLDSDFNAVSIKQINDRGESKELTLSALASGVVLLHQEGRDIIKVMTQGFDSHSGGQFNMIYLSNGVFNSYETFNMELVRNGSTWTLQTNGQGGRVAFSTMFMKGRRLFGRIIGIESVLVK